MAEMSPKRRCKCVIHGTDESWHGRSSGVTYHRCSCGLCLKYMASYKYSNYVPRERKPRKETVVDRRHKLWEAQDGICLLCHLPIPWEDACLDHDHLCCDGQAKNACGSCDRGVLHRHCNSILGHAHDDVKLLAQAIEYLESLS